MKKAMKITGWIITGLISVVFIFSIYGKISGMTHPNMINFGLEEWINIILIGEIVSLLLFLVPKTQSLGTLMLSSYMGGAIVAHMGQGEPILVQSVVLVMIWVASALRNPKTLSSFLPKIKE